MERAVFTKMAAEVWPACLPVVVPHTTPDLTAAALRSLQPLVAGLDAAVTLVAVQVVPRPLPLDHPDVDPNRLGGELHRLVSNCDVPVRVVVILARERESALQQMIPAGSLVMVPVRKRWWKTAEERMAGALHRKGLNVTLLPVEKKA